MIVRYFLAPFRPRRSRAFTSATHGGLPPSRRVHLREAMPQ
jgi:hypothetical protein